MTDREWIEAYLAGSGQRRVPLRGGVAVEVDAASGHRDQQWQRVKVVYRVPLPGEGR